MKIPPVADNWTREQPSPNDILLSEEYAHMITETLRKLPEYSYTRPTGEYTGKMWKCRYESDDLQAQDWLLYWYDCDSQPGFTITHSILIKIVSDKVFYVRDLMVGKA